MSFFSPHTKSWKSGVYFILTAHLSFWTGHILSAQELHVSSGYCCIYSPRHKSFFSLRKGKKVQDFVKSPFEISLVCYLCWYTLTSEFMMGKNPIFHQCWFWKLQAMLSGGLAGPVGHQELCYGRWPSSGEGGSRRGRVGGDFTQGWCKEKRSIYKSLNVGYREEEHYFKFELFLGDLFCLCTFALGISSGNSIGFCEFERLGLKINWGASR